MKKFESEFFKTADDLVVAKDAAWVGVEKRRERLDGIRKFSNGMATMTTADAQALGRTEIINHLTTYSKLRSQESAIQSMVTGTKNLVGIIFDSDDAEGDLVLGQRIAEALNKGAFNFKGKFANIWKKVAGEIVMAGGVPTTLPPRYGWLPETGQDMFFPPATELDADRITYAFEADELTYGDLKNMLRTLQEGKGKVLHQANITHLISVLQRQIKEGTKETSSFGREITRSVRDSDDGVASDKLSVWHYYELKYRANGTKFVSKTTFCDAMQVSTTGGEPPRSKEDSSSALIIAYMEEAYKDAFEWLTLIAIDGEIGAVKNTDTLRGLAEIMYPSAVEMEDLLNLQIEGDKIRARPKVKITGSANLDAVAKWDITQDLIAPDGVEEMPFKSGNQQLMTPFGLLDHNAAQLTGTPSAGGGDQKLPEAKANLQLGGEVRANRLIEAYNCLDILLEACVWRLLAGPMKAGCEGYEEQMYVREKLKAQGIDPAAVATREFGRFKFITVRANRVIGAGDRREQIETSDWLMANMAAYPPASRPIILRDATALRTQDPDKAELLVVVPEIIINQQRVIAENEWDTISRRAAIGQSISPTPEDIHNNHIPTHMLDMQAHIGKNDHAPWTMLDALSFSAMTDHTAEHIQILMGNPVTNFEATQFLQSFQQLIRTAQPLFKAIEETQGEGAKLTAKEQADIQLKMADLELKAQTLGINLADLQSIRKLREDRQALSTRQQYVREIQDQKRLELETQKLKLKQTSPGNSQ